MSTYTCQRCGDQFDKKSNTERSCQFHRAIYVCRLHTEGKDYYGVDVGDWNGKFWDCCGQEHPDSKPCANGKHVTYDEKWRKFDDITAKLILYDDIDNIDEYTDKILSAFSDNEINEMLEIVQNEDIDTDKDVHLKLNEYKKQIRNLQKKLKKIDNENNKLKQEITEKLHHEKVSIESLSVGDRFNVFNTKYKKWYKATIITIPGGGITTFNKPSYFSGIYGSFMNYQMNVNHQYRASHCNGIYGSYLHHDLNQKLSAVQTPLGNGMVIDSDDNYYKVEMDNMIVSVLKSQCNEIKRNLVKVHYDGLSNQEDELIDIDSNRLKKIN